jgi:hypothetical protein
MALDGYYAWTYGETPQAIIDEFEPWIAAGMPSDSPLLKLDFNKIPL